MFSSSSTPTTTTTTPSSSSSSSSSSFFLSSFILSSWIHNNKCKNKVNSIRSKKEYDNNNNNNDDDEEEQLQQKKQQQQKQQKKQLQYCGIATCTGRTHTSFSSSFSKTTTTTIAKSGTSLVRKIIMFCVLYFICTTLIRFRYIQNQVIIYDYDYDHFNITTNNSTTPIITTNLQYNQFQQSSIIALPTKIKSKEQMTTTMTTLTTTITTTRMEDKNSNFNNQQNNNNEIIIQNQRISCIIHKPLHFNISNKSPRLHNLNTNIGILTHSSKTISSSSEGTNNSTTIQGQHQDEDNINNRNNNTYPCGTLQRQWYKINEPKTKYGKLIQRNQRNTTKPIMIYYLNNLFGIGSHCLLYSQALCNAIIANGYRLQIKLEDQYESWLWSDQSYCKNDSTNHTNSSIQSHISPFKCYFPQTELQQEFDITATTSEESNNNSTFRTPINKKNSFPNATVSKPCSIVDESDQSRKEWRIGTIEYLFQELNPIIIQEAQRQIGIIFGSDDTTTTTTSSNHDNNNHIGGGNLITVPDDLITVHIRWGDKFWEMKLAKIEEYIEAIKQMLIVQYYHKQQEKQYQYQNINYYKQPTTVKTKIKIDQNSTNNETIIDTFLYNSNNNSTSHSSNDTNTTIVSIIEQYMNDRELYDNITSTANIYIATEDPIAINDFLEQKPKGWNVYYDITVHELQSLRPKRGNRASWMTRNTKGRAGLIALGSLLVALESNYFILTTSSNWSVILNYLRLSIVNNQCMNCTTMIDLRPKIW